MSKCKLGRLFGPNPLSSALKSFRKTLRDRLDNPNKDLSLCLFAIAAVWTIFLLSLFLTSSLPNAVPKTDSLLEDRGAFTPVLKNWLTTVYSYRETSHKAYGKLNAMGGTLNHLVEGCRQIATDWRELPLGSIIAVPGVGKCIVTDCGGMVKGHHIDIHYSNLSEMRQRGSCRSDITVLRFGWTGHTSPIPKNIL